MRRLLFLCLVSSGLALAADPSTLAPLKSDVEQKTKTWESLAKSLEPKIATLLPCDTNVIASIDEVSRASDARLSAFEAYFEQAATVALHATQRAEESAKDTNTELLKTELSETAERRAGIESQLAPLSTAATTRQELAPAEAALRNVAGIVDKGTLVVNKQMALEVPRQDGARNLTAIYQARETALQELSSAHADEASAWRAYYSARLARAKAECSAVTPKTSQTRSTATERASSDKSDKKDDKREDKKEDKK
jgi:hypothetical protein